MKILKNLNLKDVIFIDIETVKGKEKLEKGTDLYKSFSYKMRNSSEQFNKDISIEELYNQRSALYAEFNKIVCITIGKIKDNKLILKSYYGDDEKNILKEFSEVLDKFYASNKSTILCGLGLLGFDIPVLMRRMLINSIELPDCLDIAGLKEWNIKHIIDISVLWKATSWYSASLINIAVALGLPSPKSDIDGSETSQVYYNGELQRIVEYCERDVHTVCNVILRLRGEQPVEAETVKEVVTEKVPLMTKVYNSGKITEKETSLLNDALSELSEDEQSMAKDILDVTLPKTKRVK